MLSSYRRGLMSESTNADATQRRATPGGARPASRAACARSARQRERDAAHAPSWRWVSMTHCKIGETPCRSTKSGSNEARPT